MATVRNLKISVMHLYCWSPAQRRVASGSFQMRFPYSPLAVRIHIVRQTEAPAAEHRLLCHPWCVRDPDGVIARGVLTAPSIADLHRFVRAQYVKEDLKCFRYQIGRMGQDATRPRQDWEETLPLCQLIVLYRVDDIGEWFPANNDHDPLDVMVLESYPEHGEDPDATPRPQNGREPFFDRQV